MNIELLTKADLLELKNSIMNELKEFVNNNSSQKPEYLRTKQVCALLQISQSALQNLRVQGQLESYRVGGTLYYKYAEVIALIEKGRMR